MPLLSFMPEMAYALVQGRKNTTMRRTARGKAGDIVYLWCKQRAPKSDPLRMPIGITRLVADPIRIKLYYNSAEVGGECVADPKELVRLAKADGFASYAEMIDFFLRTYKHNPDSVIFEGYLHTLQTEPVYYYPVINLNDPICYHEAKEDSRLNRFYKGYLMLFTPAIDRLVNHFEVR